MRLNISVAGTVLGTACYTRSLLTAVLVRRLDVG
jgi:hypothetical protein